MRQERVKATRQGREDLHTHTHNDGDRDRPRRAGAKSAEQRGKHEISGDVENYRRRFREQPHTHTDPRTPAAQNLRTNTDAHVHACKGAAGKKTKTKKGKWVSGVGEMAGRREGTR